MNLFLIAASSYFVCFISFCIHTQCSRYPLRIGSATIPIVKVIRVFMFPFAFPLAICLDCLLGRELATTYTNAEMMQLLKIHVDENVIDQEAANAMTGALTYKVGAKEETVFITCFVFLLFLPLAGTTKHAQKKIHSEYCNFISLSLPPSVEHYCQASNDAYGTNIYVGSRREIKL